MKNKQAKELTCYWKKYD